MKRNTTPVHVDFVDCTAHLGDVDPDKGIQVDPRILGGGTPYPRQIGTIVEEEVEEPDTTTNDA